MRVLLIHLWNPEIFPPPAIGYLRAALTVAGHEVKSAYLSHYPEGPFDVIGVSLHSFSVQYVPHVLIQLRHRYPGAHIVAGGHHASALPEETLALGFDQAVVGPGELALHNIVNGERTKIFKTPPVVSLLIPDYTDLEGPWTMPLGSSVRGIGVLSSVGCPFECSFCASANFWEHRWYPLSVDDAMHSLTTQILKYKLSGWMFEDDNFTLKTMRAIELCERIKRDPITSGLQWQAASRAESLCSAPLCKAMREAGCTHVWLGIESLCQKTLDRCRKSTHVEAMLEGIATAKAHGITSICQFIVGLPGETEETFLETVNTARKAGLKNIGPNKAWVLPGTDIHKKALEHGFTNDQYLAGVSHYEYEWPAGTLNRWESMLRSV